MTFRVYPGSRHGFYYRVVICSSIAAMRRRSRRYKRIPGMWCVAQVIKFNTRKRCLGEIHFAQGFLRRRASTAIAHEATHAALWYASRRGLSNSASPPMTGRYLAFESWEEQVAYAVGSLTRQIVGACYDQGIFQ